MSSTVRGIITQDEAKVLKVFNEATQRTFAPATPLSAQSFPIGTRVYFELSGALNAEVAVNVRRI